MTKEQYIKITEPLRSNPRKAECVKKINRLLTGMVFLTYPLYLVLLLLKKDPWLLQAIFVPAVSFVLLTVARRLINAPRPYEKFGMPPVIEKDTSGNSFPSRHVFSVFIIAMTIFYQYPLPGIVLGIVGVGIAVIRVLGGVHEPKDVIAGAVTGILCGVIGFYLI